MTAALPLEHPDGGSVGPPVLTGVISGPKIRSAASISSRPNGFPELPIWITDSQLVALISDHFAIERIRPHAGPQQAALAPLHEHCLSKSGVHLGELWCLSDWPRIWQNAADTGSC